MRTSVQSLRPMCGSTIASFFVATLASLSAAFAQPMRPGNEQHSMPGMDSPQKVGLAQEVAQLRSRIAQIQAALAQNQPVGMAMDDEMGMGGAANKPAMNSKDMPAAAGCCSGMMGKMAVAGAASTTMPSELPGSPAVSDIYHVGATGFFLDYSAAIKLTPDQQAALNGIKEKSIGDLAAAQRQIDRVEQELWMLTRSDQPDSMLLEMKVRDIERLRGDQRIAFIRSVGGAARVLTDDQRAALLGTGVPGAAQATAPQGSVGSARGKGSTDPKGGMAGMGDDDSMGGMGGNTPDTEAKNSGMGDM